MKSMKTMVQGTGASNVRYFGKFYGRERDYYVLEGVLEGEEEEDV